MAFDIPYFISALDAYGFEDLTDDEKVRAIQGAVWEIERQRPWPFLETSVVLTFNGSSAVPTNHPSDLRAVVTMRDASSGYLLQPVRTDDLEESSTASLATTGTALLYYPQGGQVNFYPVPPSGQTIRMRYLRYTLPLDSTSLETDILIPRRFFEVVMFGAVMRLLDKEDDPELGARIEGHYRRALTEMVEDAFKFQYDEPDFVSVTDPNDWLD